jgi:hypothetical protein
MNVNKVLWQSQPCNCMSKCRAFQVFQISNPCSAIASVSTAEEAQFIAAGPDMARALLAVILFCESCPGEVETALKKAGVI